MGQQWSGRGFDGNIRDDVCGRWIVGLVVLAAEIVTQGVDGVSLESDVSVDADGDADVGVDQNFLDHDEVDALLQEQGCGGVAEVSTSG